MFFIRHVFFLRIIKDILNIMTTIFTERPEEASVEIITTVS